MVMMLVMVLMMTMTFLGPITIVVLARLTFSISIFGCMVLMIHSVMLI